MIGKNIMKINLYTQNLELTDVERAEIEEKIGRLAKFVAREEPVIVDVHLIDEAGGTTKNGPDQIAHINLLLGKEQIFIEEKAENHIKAFELAYHRLKRRVEDHHERETEER